jgi:hypothetical protein
MVILQDALEFIMHASDNYDLYALGKSRLLVNRHNLKLETLIDEKGDCLY